MKCIRCRSVELVRFVDMEGNRRIFCRRCHLNIPEDAFFRIGLQKTLNEFRQDSYYRYFSWLRA